MKKSRKLFLGIALVLAAGIYYYVALPAFLLSAMLSLGLSGVIGNAIGGLLQDIKLASYIGPVQLVIVAVCAAIVIAVSVLLASISIMRKKPKDILTDLS